MPHQCTGCGHVFEDGSKEMLSGCPDCGGNKFQFRPASDADGDSADGTEAGSKDESSTDRSPPPTDDTRSAGPPERADSSSVAETVGRATTKVRDFVSSNPNPPASEPTSEANPDAEWPDDWQSHAGGSTDDATVDSPSSSRASNPSTSGGETDRDIADSERPDSEKSAGEGIIDADARRDTAEDEDAESHRENAAQASARTDVVSADELEDSAVLDGPAESETASALDDRPTDSDGEVVSEPTGEDPDLAELREQLNDQFESIKILEPGQYELNLMELYDREEYIIALQENGRYVIQVPEQWIGEDVDDR